GKFNGNEDALSCDGMETKGDVFLRGGFEATGTVRLLGSKIGGDLACRDGKFQNDISAHNANIGGNVFLDEGFQIHGTVHLPNVTIGGNVYCDGGTFHNKEQAIQANKAVIEGNVILGDMNAAGKLAFQSTTIKGDFSANGATLSGKPSVELRNAKIEGTFHWRDVTHALGRLDLGGASAKTLNMDAASWDKPESIKLNNFSYLGFESLETGASSSYWKDFLRKQPEKDLTEKFRPKPWEHLASVLDTMGYEEEARSLRIERQKLRTQFMANFDPDRFEASQNGNDNQNRKTLHAMTVFWRKLFSGPLVDYGYRPGKAVIYLLLLILIGTGIYWKAAFNGIMAPTHPLIFKEAANGFIPTKCADNWVYFPTLTADDLSELESNSSKKTKCEEFVPSEYSEFQSFIYAADIALPIVNLRMESDWSPRVVNTDGSRNWWGYSVRAFEWFLIIAGWVLSLLFASAVGGIIRR
ncbi:MAG: polymer-forming cytoskeletal protein, partial [Salaquimonas sp.]